MSPDLETRLRRELGRRGDALTDAPLTLDAVTGRARQIRRRQRRNAALGAVAVVAALAVPAALLVPDVADRTGPRPATGAPELSEGPLLPYVRQGVLVRPDGESVRVPAGDWHDAVLLADGRLLLAGSNETGARIVDVDGEVSPLSGDVVADADAEAAAWARPDGSVVVLGEDGAVTELPGGRLSGVELTDVTAVALLGDTCAEPRTGDDCRVVFEGMRPDGTVVNLVSSSDDGTAEPFVPAFGSVSDVSLDERFVAGQVSVTEDGGCSGVWSTLLDLMTWPEPDCNLTRMQFAPDGRRLYAVDVRSDGLGPTKGYLVGIDDDVVHATLDPSGTILDVAWETTASLLAVVHREGIGFFLVRFTLGGSEDDLIGPIPGDPLETRPLMLP